MTHLLNEARAILKWKKSLINALPTAITVCSPMKPVPYLQSTHCQHLEGRVWHNTCSKLVVVSQLLAQSVRPYHEGTMVLLISEGINIAFQMFFVSSSACLFSLLTLPQPLLVHRLHCSGGTISIYQHWLADHLEQNSTIGIVRSKGHKKNCLVTKFQVLKCPQNP